MNTVTTKGKNTPMLISPSDWQMS